MTETTWDGKFSSTSYSALLAAGNIRVIGLRDKDVQEEYEAKATVIYTGVYKNGKAIETSVKVSNKPTGEKVGEGPTMSIQLGRQVITFTVERWEPEIISGKYSCADPVDQGQFFLQPKGTPETPNSSQCCIQ